MMVQRVLIDPSVRRDECLDAAFKERDTCWHFSYVVIFFTANVVVFSNTS